MFDFLSEGQGRERRLYLRESERWRRRGELVGVSCIQDERNHVVLPRLHFHGYCGLRCVHSYPAHRVGIRKEFYKSTRTYCRDAEKLAPESARYQEEVMNMLHITPGECSMQARRGYLACWPGSVCCWRS